MQSPGCQGRHSHVTGTSKPHGFVLEQCLPVKIMQGFCCRILIASELVPLKINLSKFSLQVQNTDVVAHTDQRKSINVAALHFSTNRGYTTVQDSLSTLTLPLVK